MLTPRQNECLQYLYAHQREYGFCPSYQLIAEHLGLVSKSGVHRLVLALEERGFISRLPHRARAITVLRVPADILVRSVINNDQASNSSYFYDWLRPVAESINRKCGGGK